MDKNDQKWTKTAKKLKKKTKHVLRLQTKIRLTKYLNVLVIVNISKSESIASTLLIAQSKKVQKLPKTTKQYQKLPAITPKLQKIQKIFCDLVRMIS